MKREYAHPHLTKNPWSSFYLRVLTGTVRYYGGWAKDWHGDDIEARTVQVNEMLNCEVKYMEARCLRELVKKAIDRGFSHAMILAALAVGGRQAGISRIVVPTLKIDLVINQSNNGASHSSPPYRVKNNYQH